jgi:dTDP-4-dehydrorhamnose reductase
VKLLVTGANGQVGWELRCALAPLGDVVALDRKVCDLSRPQTLPHIIRDIGPDVIINAAAYTAVDKAEEEEALATTINATAVGRIAEEARKLGVLLIHYSTNYVFDGAKETPYNEDDLPHPLNAYGRSKLAGERAIEQCGGSSLILRTSGVFAARGHNFLRTILRLARERDELRIVADQIGAPTWARAIADATASIVCQACREKQTGIFTSGLFHVTAGGSASWFEFAQAILELAPSPIGGSNKPAIHPVSSAEYADRTVRPKNGRLAGDRVYQRFGIALSEWKQALLLCMQDMNLREEN